MGKRKAAVNYQKKSRKKTYKFRGNQYCADEDDISSVTDELETASEAESEVLDDDSSASKMLGLPFLATNDSDDDESDLEEEIKGADGNRIIYLPALQELLDSCCVCQKCKAGRLVLAQKEEQQGLAPAMQLSCSKCKFSSSGTLGKRQIRGRSHFYDVNRKAVFGMRLLGHGLTGLKTLCSVLDMPPPMSKQTFDCHQSALHRAAKETGEQSFKQAANAVRLKRVECERPDEIAVSTDGTWMRRGHSSLNGVQTVISHDTCQILDVEVLSKHCAQCTSQQARKQNGSISAAEFDAWKAGQSPSCSINTSSSAPAMESEAVLNLWKRSEEKTGMKYVHYIGDGDSKGFSTVSQAKPYGETPITKECIGHVQKRLGKALRELKKKLRTEKLSDGKPLCGKGRLTHKYIDRLQNYYGRAIRVNVGDVEGTYKAIWASLCHRASTDEKSRHEFCPTGVESWCLWQQKKAGKDVTVIHQDPLPEAVLHAIKPIYVRLSERPLLERCLRGATQNVNECYNSTLWKICPKESFCGADTVETSVHLSALMFNNGNSSLLSVLKGMGCSISPYLKAGLESRDTRRLYYSSRKSSKGEKAARKRRGAVRMGLADTAAEKEGETYAAGAF